MPSKTHRPNRCIKWYYEIRWNSLESAGDGGLMVIGLSGSLGDGDGSRLVSMVPTPFVCMCCIGIGCMETGGGGDRRPFTPDINAPGPWWPAVATMALWLTLPAPVVPFCWSPSTGNPFSDRNSSRSQYWKTKVTIIIARYKTWKLCDLLTLNKNRAFEKFN